MNDAGSRRRPLGRRWDLGDGGGGAGGDRSGNRGLLGRPPDRGRSGGGSDGGWSDDRGGGDGDDGPPSGLAILAFLAAVALAIIGGYFLVMKLIEISHREDCMLGGGRSCVPPIELRRD